MGTAIETGMVVAIAAEDADSIRATTVPIAAAVPVDEFLSKQKFIFVLP
jgi:hypothetical protein